jgi:hypothetical protein
MSLVTVVDIFHQNYGPEDGIPSHWSVKYYRNKSAWPEYKNTETYEEAEAWIRQNAVNAEDFI